MGIEPVPPPWEEVRAELLPDWIRERPCTRPYAWWDEDEEAKEPRRQVGGGECIPHTRPDYMAHGIPIPGHWTGDADNLPVFESQAAYLQRHNLLTATEKRWLANHPEALEPVTLKYERIGMGLSNETLD